MQRKIEAIVIGTSAGGLHALLAILPWLSANYPIPIIVVQHRAKEQKHMLEDVLQSKTKIRIKQADEKECIQKGIVYTAPPDYHLLVERDRSFSLNSDELVRYSRPSIDVLFETAAPVYNQSLAAIILTGASNDGAEGIRMIKEYGGCTIAQDPSEAAFSVMPAAAIKTGKVDRIWKLDEIGNFLKGLELK